MKIPPTYGPENAPGKIGEALIQPFRSVSGESGAAPGQSGGERAPDSVTISGGEKALERSERTVYSMSDLKKNADNAMAAERALRALNADSPEPLIDSQLGITREELVELVRLRIDSGYYERPDVIDSIAGRILDSL